MRIKILLLLLALLTSVGDAQKRSSREPVVHDPSENAPPPISPLRPFVTVLNGASNWGGTPQYIVKQVLISPTVNNGGFELAGAGGADVFAAWTESAGTGRIADTSESMSGSHALVLQVGGGSGVIFISTTSTLLAAGRSYKLTFRAKCDNGTGIVIGSGTAGYAEYRPTISTSWERYTSVFTASENSALTFQRIGIVPNRKYLIDDITLEEVEGSADLNGGEMLSNPTFDANVTGWGAIGNATLVYKTNRTHSGAGSAALIVTSNGTVSMQIQSPYIANTSTNKYTLSAWVYCPSSNSSRTVVLRLENEGGATIGTTSKVVDPATWTNIVLNVQLDGTQTAIKPRVYHSSAVVGDTLYADDISLTQSSDAVLWMGAVNAGNRTFSALDGIFYAFNSTSNANYAISGTTGNTSIRMRVGDDNTTVAANGAAISDGKAHGIAYVIGRTTGEYTIVDTTKSSITSISSVGKISGINSIYIGRYLTANITGRIGQTYLVKYTSGLLADIDSRIATANAIYKSGRIVPPWVWGPTATVVGNWDWSQGGRDQSGMGNHLQPQGGAYTTPN